MLIYYCFENEMNGIQYPFEGDAIVHTAFVQTGDELHFFSETTKREKEMFTGGGVKETRDLVDGIRYIMVLLIIFYEISYGKLKIELF